jgi:hypothetical protein
MDRWCRRRRHVGMKGSILARKTMGPSRGLSPCSWSLETSLINWALETNYWNTTSGTRHLRAKVCAQSLAKKDADFTAHRSSAFDVIALAVAIRYANPNCAVVAGADFGKCISCKELFIRQCKKCRNEYCREDNDASSETMVCGYTQTWSANTNTIIV